MEHLYSLFLRSSGITTDSRCVEPGMLFFALKGENFNGNLYANKALSAGALCAVVDDSSVMIGCAGYFLTSDVLTTLQDLAAYHRAQLGIPIVALTGSNGKTTTKEFLRLALSVKYRVGCTEGNFNNHIGVPLTLLSFDSSIEVGVVEMGANHCGEIASLCRIAGPNVGLITNVGRAHLEGFGGEHGVRRGKGELFDYLKQSGGMAIYNLGNKILCQMVTERPGLRALGYLGADISLNGSLFGGYNYINAVAALAVAQFMGAERDDAIRAIESYEPKNNRSQLMQTERSNTVVADCYNANPSSMEAAIGEFRNLDTPKHKVLILGEMRELGKFSDTEHRRIAELASSVSTDIYYVGRGFSGEPSVFENVDLLKEYLTNNPINDSVILLKGSRSVKLEQLIPIL